MYFNLIYLEEKKHVAYVLLNIQLCSCGSVVEHCISSAKVVDSIPREHNLIINVLLEFTVSRFG